MTFLSFRNSKDVHMGYSPLVLPFKLSALK